MCVLFFLSVLLFGEENVPALGNNYFELWHRAEILKRSFILQRLTLYFLSAWRHISAPKPKKNLWLLKKKKKKKREGVCECYLAFLKRQK